MEEMLLKEWQERLGLQDWAIILNYNCKKEDMEDPDYSVGETQWSTTSKCARISIISKEEYDNDRILEYDFEKTLVHELLHIKFSLIDKDLNTYEGIVAESARHQLIDDLARAFVMAKRGQTKRRLNCAKVKDMSKNDKCDSCEIKNLDIDKIIDESNKMLEKWEEERREL